jgi:hypothetical protein
VLLEKDGEYQSDLLVRNEEVLQRVEKRNILETIKRRKANRIFYILSRN